MTYEDIYQLLQYNQYESMLFIPNEIFEDLKANIHNAPHIAFAYTYIYLVTWLYRYTKYYNVSMFDNTQIKEILGYDSNNRTLNYLIKKNGLLDEMEYLESTKEYPVLCSFSKEEKRVEITMSSEFEDMKDYLPSVPKRFFLKRPLKAFYRIITEDGEEYEEVGTFSSVNNTHSIPFEVFLYCMSNKEIGCAGFYLYAYLKHKNDLFVSGYDVSLVALSVETGITERTLDKYLGLLKSYRLIGFRHNQEYFAIGMLKEDRKANTYIINDYEFFNDKAVPFNRIEIMSKSDYFKTTQENNKVSNNTVDKRLDFNFDELPY